MPRPLFFQPKLLVALHGYDRQRLLHDIGAGLTVGVVALPLAMAFAIASGLKPEAGLFTAIIAGFLISALGGSRVQIGGPAGAFIVIVYGIVERHGLANLLIATAMSGLMLFAMGLFKLGTLVRFIPVAVVIGFTNGIAVLIALSQIKDFLGLRVAAMPADFFGMLATLRAALPSVNGTATLLALACLVLLLLWQFALPAWGRRQPVLARLALVPGSIVVLVLATTGVAVGHWPVETIGSRFGGIPTSLPVLQWPALNWDTARFLFMPALTLALLGAIESLLCARVADGLTGDRHAGHRHHCTHGHQCQKRRQFTGGRHGACADPAAGDAGRSTAGQPHSAGGDGGDSDVRGLEHGPMARICAVAPVPPALPDHAADRVCADGRV